MIEVKNRTATPQTLSLTAGPRLDVAQTALAQANGSVEIEVRAKGDDAEFADQVTVDGAGTKTIVLVHAAALAMDKVAVATTPAPMPAKSRPPQGAAPVAVAGTLESAMPGLETPGSSETTPGFPVCTLGVGESTQTTAQVGCDFKGVPLARSYRVETRSIKLDPQGNAVAQWTPFIKDAALTVKGTVVIAQMQNLQPGMQYVVRLVGLDGHGNVIEASSAEAVRTVMAKKGWTWQWPLLAAAVLGIGTWAWRRRRPV